MPMQLTKTLLTKKPSPQSFLVGIFSYLVLLTVFVVNNRNLTANGEAIYQQGQYWRAFTTTLMHADFVHLGHNTLFFTGFAVLLNAYFGFWVFPVLSFFIGGLINLIALRIYEPHIYLVGISGVIYFMGSFWMTMFTLLERQHKVGKRLLISIAVSLILFWPDLHVERVSYLAHGLGFALGVPSAMAYFLLLRDDLRGHEVWKEKIVHRDLDLEEQAMNFEGQKEDGALE